MERAAPTCHFCRQPFEANGALDTCAWSEMVAYDPERGRLWLVCASCRRWNLRPIEERWEALESLERLRRDRARLLAETANIALLEAGPLRLVRVGRAGLREEAWWRYGRELMRRHQRILEFTRRGEALDVILDVLAPVMSFLLVGWPFRRQVERVDSWVQGERLRSFGPFAWRGTLRCAVCGSERNEFPIQHSGELAIRPDAEGLALWMRCAECRSLYEPASGHLLTGVQARRVLRRVLAWENYDGATEKQIDVASELIEEAGTAAALVDALVKRRPQLGRLKSRELLSLEIALSHEDERLMAGIEAAELDHRWRLEEAIARIVDRELTPWPSSPRPRPSSVAPDRPVATR